MGNDQHQAVADEIPPAGGIDERLFMCGIHGFLIGRSEHIDRCTLGHLLQQGTGSAEIELQLAVRIPGLIRLADILEGIGEAGSGRNGQFGGLRAHAQTAPQHDRTGRGTT